MESIEVVDLDKVAALLLHHERLLSAGKVKITLAIEPEAQERFASLVEPIAPSVLKIDDELPREIARQRLVSGRWAADFGGVGHDRRLLGG